jgi:formate-dependent nitrite reductase membrane component NrfD
MKSVWLLARLIMLTAVAATSPLFYRQMYREFDNDSFSWSFVFTLLCLVILSVLFVLALQYKNPFSEQKWLKPSWKANPFNPWQPAQAFHASGWIFIVLGISLGIYTALIGSRNLLCIFPLTIGIGVMVGLKLAVLVFRARFI